MLMGVMKEYKIFVLLIDVWTDFHSLKLYLKSFLSLEEKSPVVGEFTDFQTTSI